VLGLLDHVEPRAARLVDAGARVGQCGLTECIHPVRLDVDVHQDDVQAARHGRYVTRRLPAMPTRYWLMKSEPDVFSIQDLASAPRQTAFWDGVRNYQARNFLRDQVAVGDGVLFYHSSAAPPAIAGTAAVVTAAAPDPSQFDPKSEGYDPA